MSKKILYGLLFLMFLLVAVRPIYTNDAFIYLSIAKTILQANGLPLIDPFIYSITDYKWNINHEWLGFLIFYALHAMAGWPLLYAFQLLINLLTVFTPAIFSTQLTKNYWPVVLVLSVALWAAKTRFATRTSIFTDLFIVSTLAIALLYYYKRSKLYYALPGIFLIWTNTHPGFYIGLFCIGLPFLFSVKSLLDKGHRKYLAFSLLSLLACMLNPHGLGGFLFPLRTMSESEWGIYRMVNPEWIPTYHAYYINNYGAWGFVVTFLIAGLILLFSKSRDKYKLLAVYGLFLYLGLNAFRHISWTSLCAAILAVSSLHSNDRAFTKTRERSIIFVVTAINVLLAAIVYSRDSNKVHWALNGFSPMVSNNDFPINGTRFIIENNLDGNLFNDHKFGGYLTYNLPPGRKIFCHGFIDDQKFLLNDYLKIVANKGEFDRITKKYDIEVFLLSSNLIPRGKRVNPKNVPYIISMLFTGSEWSLVFYDPISLVIVKNISKYQDVVSKYGLAPKVNR